MSLKHAIVGFLLENAMHGYELKRALSPALGREGLVNDGVLYPVLAKLVKDGLVKKTVVGGGARPDRHVLSPTKKGAAWFYAWLEGTGDEEDDVTYDFFLGHPFLAKYVFFQRLSPEVALGKLATHREHAEAKLRKFREIRATMVVRKVERRRIAVLDLGIAQQEAKIQWLRRELVATRRSRRR